MTGQSSNTTFLLSLFLCTLAVESLSRSNLTAATASQGISKEMMYTQNSLCRQNSCTNPIFPGINDLPRLEALQWQCSTTSTVHQHMGFCKDAVMYDPALPSPTSKSSPITELVKSQEDAAQTMFFYHLSGMGFDAWDFQNPSQSDNNCVRSVWKMVCFTYFPRAEAGCKTGEQSLYKRPCMNSCQNYLRHCAVECCDESVQCVFAHTATSSTGQTKLLQTGYVDQSGPSATCTGSAKRSMSSPLLILFAIFGLHCATVASNSPSPTEEVRGRRRGIGPFLLLSLLGLLTVALQGCDVAIPHHKVGNWRTKPNYLNEYKYVPLGKDASSAVLNSCGQTDVPATSRCSGRGFCKTFSSDSLVAKKGSPPISFCQCERDWADPECGTKRKSQMKAFFFSVFLGPFGADYFYLGYPFWGLGKLVTFGGFGVWWLIDIVRTGAGPVYAHSYRTANDLPHWVAVLIMISLCMCTGLFAAIQNYLLYRRQKRLDLANFNNKEEARQWSKSEEEMQGFDGPRYRAKILGQGTGDSWEGRPRFCGYGATLPLPHHNPAGNPYAEPDHQTHHHMGFTGVLEGLTSHHHMGEHHQTNIAGPYGPAGKPGQGSPTPVGVGYAPTHMGLDRQGVKARIDDNEVIHA